MHRAPIILLLLFTALMIALFAAVSLNVPRPAAAQSDDWWRDGCDPKARDLLDPTNTVYGFDLDAACETYRTCNTDGYNGNACQMAAAEVLWTQCAPDAALCQQSALLYTASILAYGYPGGGTLSDFIPPDRVRLGFPAMLTAFQAGDFAAALDAITLTEEELTFDSENPVRFPARSFHMLPFARGVINAQMGEGEAALAEFDATYAMDPWLALVHVTRAPVYGALGRDAEAAADALWLSEYVAMVPYAGPSLITPLVAAYPLDQSHVDAWLRYPVLGQNSGVAGSYYSDDTGDDPRLVQVSFYADQGFAIAIGLGESYIFQPREDERPHLPNVVVLRATYAGYRWTIVEQFGEGRSSMTLSPTSDGTYYGVEELGYFEGYEEQDFILAAPDAPNPTVNLAGERCEDGAISRVRPGMIVQGAGYGYEEVFGLFDTPGGSMSTPLEPYAELTILAGDPVCDAGVMWWQASFEGITGWVPENRGKSYVINPFNPHYGEVFGLPFVNYPGRLFYCPGVPEARLATGAEAQVVPGLGANNVRETPRVDGVDIGVLEEGSTFLVLSGPACGDGFVWWLVRQDTLTGWTAEGDASGYWLAPLGQ